MLNCNTFYQNKKQSRFELLCFMKLFAQLLFDIVDQNSECFGIRYSDLSQHFSVQIDLRKLQAVHELRIVDIVHAASGRDSGDPKSAEISLLLLSADVCVGQRTHNSLVCCSELLALSTIKAFGKL